MASNNHNYTYIPTTSVPLSSTALPFQPSFTGGTTRRPETFASATSRLDFSTPYIPFTQPLSAPYYTHQTGSTNVTTAPAFTTAIPYGFTAQYPYNNMATWPQYGYSAPPNLNQPYTAPPAIPTAHASYIATQPQSDPVTLIA